MQKWVKRDQVEGEEVVAIFRSNAYLVCTANRGVVRGLPILVGRDEVRNLVLFE